MTQQQRSITPSIAKLCHAAQHLYLCHCRHRGCRLKPHAGRPSQPKFLRALPHPVLRQFHPPLHGHHHRALLQTFLQIDTMRGFGKKFYWSWMGFNAGFDIGINGVCDPKGVWSGARWQELFDWVC